ncbi:hypothetical protein D9Q98_004724 [Chlorella vulgaris]|uniref:Polynucleotide adenylyltransferase n=1 Tax=Chlorella vulgaris TaxID=3077 RepID=A0A9D4TQG8_CHLVU|nr:hypothetical protein D9Q98_004724 [Chlorella vulgaris]
MRRLACSIVQQACSKRLLQTDAAAGRASARATSAAPCAALLSTSAAPAETQWQQVLREAATALTGSVGGSRSATAVAGAEPQSPGSPPRVPVQLQDEDWERAPLPPSRDRGSSAAAAASSDLPQPAHAAARPSRPALRRRRRGALAEAAAAVVPSSSSDGITSSSIDSGNSSSSGNPASLSPAHSKGKGSAKAKKPRRERSQGPQPALASSSEGSTDLCLSAAVGSELQDASLSCALPVATVLQDDAHPIRDADISRSAWFVLARLRAAGHEAYIVGGTIRDLLLGGTPKDFDLLTSAELHQIKRLFSRSLIVGRSFPVCHVHAEGTMIEVSSFSTGADPQLIPGDASIHMIGRQKLKGSDRGKGATWAAARSDNASKRDFTVNGLLYDPFSRLLFDCVGGVADCEARRLRTICPPRESFETDPARILRAVRLAARAGLALDGDTGEAIEDQVAAIGKLPQGRLQMEVGSLLGYGAAERSLALMWRLGMLDMLLPQVALYLKRHRVPRTPRASAAASTSSTTTTATASAASSAAASKRAAKRDLLFQLAGELDRQVSPQRPVDPSVWVALLAAPLVAEQCAKLIKKERAAEQRQLKKGQRMAAAEARRQDARAALLEADRAQEGAAAAAAAGGDCSLASCGNIAGAAQGEATLSHESDGSSSSSSEEDEAGGHGRAQQDRQQRAFAARRRYMERYSQVVSEVLDSMQQSLDAATLASLSPQGKKHSEELQSAIAGSTQKRRRSGERERAAGPPDVLLRCVLSKAAVERAAALLMLEADLRGQPELQPLLGKGGPPHSTARAAHRQLQPQHVEAGMVNSEALEPEQVPEGVLLPPQQPPAQPGQLWRRLEQAFAGEAADVDDISDVAAAAAVAAEVVAAQTKLQRRRRGRKLSAEECLVLGILSNPRLGFAQATSLPGIDAAP